MLDSARQMYARQVLVERTEARSNPCPIANILSQIALEHAKFHLAFVLASDLDIAPKLAAARLQKFKTAIRFVRIPAAVAGRTTATAIATINVVAPAR